MTTTLALTALLMGLAGGPHCLAMCGLGCAGVARAASGSNPYGTALFHAGRLSGYTLLGAVAGASAQGLGWLTAQTSVLRPVWTLLLLGTLAFGLWMLFNAQQPGWLETLGRRVWGQAKTFAMAWGRGAPLAAGSLWALMPCSLLYSALLVAMLSGSAINGAVTMVLFGLASTLVMTGGTAALQWFFRGGGHNTLHVWSIRVAGLALVLSSAWALWMGTQSATGFWCFAD